MAIKGRSDAAMVSSEDRFAVLAPNSDTSNQGGHRNGNSKKDSRNGNPKSQESRRPSKGGGVEAKADKTPTDDAEGAQTRAKDIVHSEVQSLLASNSTLQLADFDYRVRQHLHALYGSGGKQRLIDGLARIHTSTFQKQRKSVKNWPAYLGALLKKLDSENKESAEPQASDPEESSSAAPVVSIPEEKVEPPKQVPQASREVSKPEKAVDMAPSRKPPAPLAPPEDLALDLAANDLLPQDVLRLLSDARPDSDMQIGGQTGIAPVTPGPRRDLEQQVSPPKTAPLVEAWRPVEDLKPPMPMQQPFPEIWQPQYQCSTAQAAALASQLPVKAGARPMVLDFPLEAWAAWLRHPPHRLAMAQ